MLLNKYEREQPVASKTLINAIKNNKISHAYLFETNDYHESNDFIMSFIKDILCPNSGCNTCNVCKQIDNNEYIDLKIINPEGIQIKKDEMLDLQIEFKSKAIEGTKKIYVLNNAEKLNSSSSNTLLKFLEEPEEDIIAILVTKNRYQMLNTIISRCQLVSFKNKTKDLNDKEFDKINDLVYNNSDLLTSDVKQEQIERVLSFIKFYEKNKNNTILFITREYLQYFKTREHVLYSFELMKLAYLDVLKYLTTKKIDIFSDHYSEISQISEVNNINDVLIKLNKIIQYIDRVKYNVNISLLMDSFIIELGDELND